jgi:PKD repeat protein
VFKKLNLLVPIALIFILSAAGVFADSPEKKPKLRHISEDNNVDAPGWELHLRPSKPPEEHLTAGVFYDIDCKDINPQVSTVIRHDQIGSTWYDFQKNGSMGRMMSVTSDGYRHFSWMYSSEPYTSSGDVRFVYGNCFNPSTGTYVGQQVVDGGTKESAGYSNQDHLNDGISVVTYHRTAAPSNEAIPYSMLAMEDAKCTGIFTRTFDIPDSFIVAPKYPGHWPKLAVKYDATAAKDYIHVVLTEGNTDPGAPCAVGYYRCYLSATNTLVCQAPMRGVVANNYILNANVNYSAPKKAVSHFDSSCSVTPISVCSPVSRKVALVYLPPACRPSCDALTDVAYCESMNSGDEWMTSDNWPPAINNLTNYGCVYPEDYRAWNDVSACYDYNDSLHIIWNTVGYPEPEYYQPGLARLWHWSRQWGVAMITSNITEDTEPGSHNGVIAKPSVSAMDPIYHPGGEPDSVYLYCIWTQFDSGDVSAAGFGNGELYGTASNDAGRTWGNVWNLTQTRTPGCLAGECLSEHWPTLATNMYNGQLHISYLCDKDPGTSLSSQDGTTWLENPVMYLEIQTWEPGDRPVTAYFSAKPTSGVAPLEVDFKDMSLGNPLFWFWDFGDGSTSTEQHPTHTYIDTGYYDVKLVVSDMAGTDSLIRSNYIKVLIPVVAQFSAEPKSGVIPLQVQFTDLSEGDPISWFWEFGDDSTSTEQNPTHTYMDTGYYDVKLVVSDGTWTNSLIRSGYIEVLPPVVAQFSAEPESGVVPLQVQFTDLSEGDPTSWFWAFGDDSTSTEQNPMHTYMDTGYYDVKLVVSDGTWTNSLIRSSYIKVLPSVVAQFSAEPESGFIPLTVQFADLSTGDPTNWFWDFGDQTTSTEQHPIHTYTNNGIYDVMFITSDGIKFDTLIRTEYIAVFDTLSVDFNANPTFGHKPLIVSFQSLCDPVPYNVIWYFGDGDSSHDLNPVHQYNDGGIYDMKLVAEIFGYNDSLIKDDFVWISDIKAEFAADKRCGSQPLEVMFTDSSTGIFPITNWHWDFGDGGTSYEQHPTHQYENTGVFDVRLIVSDGIGVDTITKEEYITTQDSVSADFNGYPTSGSSPLAVTFEPTLEGTANQYFWDFGDGDTSALRNPIHTYTTQGKYDVKLRVRLEFDDCNQVDSVMKKEYVVVNDLEAQFTADPTAGAAPLWVQFTDESSGNPDNWFWDFGDGNTSTAQSPWHEYDTAGVYDVFLRVGNFIAYDSLLKLNYILVDTLFGDANMDGTVNLSDVIFLLNYLFKEGPPPVPLEVADATCNGIVDLADAIYLLNYLFKGGPPPGC